MSVSSAIIVGPDGSLDAATAANLKNRLSCLTRCIQNLEEEIRQVDGGLCDANLQALLDYPLGVEFHHLLPSYKALSGWPAVPVLITSSSQIPPPESSSSATTTQTVVGPVLPAPVLQSPAPSVPVPLGVASAPDSSLIAADPAGGEDCYAAAAETPASAATGQRKRGRSSSLLSASSRHPSSSQLAEEPAPPAATPEEEGPAKRLRSASDLADKHGPAKGGPTTAAKKSAAAISVEAVPEAPIDLTFTPKRSARLSHSK